jgi:multidrug efflux pump subunit AcrA (membrane-fusion protein)
LLSSTLMRWCLVGGQSDDPIRNPAKSAMLAYATAAWAYRWMLLFALLYLVSRMLQPIGLESIGRVLGLFAAAGAFYSVAKPMTGFVLNPLKRRKIEMGRLLLTGTASAIAIAVLVYPFPTRVYAVATLTPNNSQSVFAAVAGFIEMAVKPGQRVSEGELIVKLRNPAIELDFVSAQGKLATQQTLVEALEQAELEDASVSERLPAARATLKDLSKQFEIHRGRLEAMEIRAMRSGIVLAGDSKPASEDDEDQLSEWIDFATDEKNRGCFVASGTEVCRIADTDSLEAELVLPQSVAGRVRQEADVRLSFVSLPEKFYEGTVLDVSRTKMSDRRGDIDATEAISALTAGTTALDVSYLVRVRMHGYADHMLPGQQGDALISTAPKSIAHRAYLLLAGLLRLR